MTIKIELDEKNLCVLDLDIFNQSKQCPQSDDRTHRYQSPIVDSGTNLDICSTRAGARVFVSSLQGGSSFSSSSPYELTESILSVSKSLSSEEESSFEDDDSSISSYGSSLCLDQRDQDGRRVQFANQLVSEVRERPRTPEEEIQSLFYSYEETQRFRQEYRLERKLEAQAGDNVNVCSKTQLLSLESESENEPDSESKLTMEDNISISKVLYNPSSLPSFLKDIEEPSRTQNRHQISQIMVEHWDSSKTFYYEEQQDSNVLDPLSISASLTSSSLQMSMGLFKLEQDSHGNSYKCSTSDNFFDDDSFWSGAITWY